MPFLLYVKAVYQRGHPKIGENGLVQYPMSVEIGTPVSYSTSEVIGAQGQNVTCKSNPPEDISAFIWTKQVWTIYLGIADTIR